MKKFTPYEKLSKKERRRLDALARGSWGAVKPVTRSKPSAKLYKREKTRCGDLTKLRNRVFFMLFSVISHVFRASAPSGAAQI